MNKIEAKKMAIAELFELQKAYVEYLDSVKDKKFDATIQQMLQTKGNIIRKIQQGLESGDYEDLS